MAISFTSLGIMENSKGAVDKPNGRALNWYAPTLDVKSQAFPGLFLYRYMEVGVFEIY